MQESPKILIVDDTPENITIIKLGLTTIDCNIFVSTGGVDALDLVPRIWPDLILLDIMMPNMNGHEVCEELKRDPTTANIPIIFVSAKDQEEDILKGLSLGAVDYVTKPFKIKEIIARINVHLKISKARNTQELKYYKACYFLRGLLDIETISGTKNFHPSRLIQDFIQDGNIDDQYGSEQLHFNQFVEIFTLFISNRFTKVMSDQIEASKEKFQKEIGIQPSIQNDEFDLAKSMIIFGGPIFWTLLGEYLLYLESNNDIESFECSIEKVRKADKNFININLCFNVIGKSIEEESKVGFCHNCSTNLKKLLRTVKGEFISDTSENNILEIQFLLLYI